MKVDLRKWRKTARLILVPTVAAFLSFIFVVIRPLSDLGGEWAFLVFTTVLLFFFPSGSIVSQLEATGELLYVFEVRSELTCVVFGVVGSALGLTWSYATLAIAAYCGRRYGADSQPANAIVGVGLALLSLVCELISSVVRLGLMLMDRWFQQKLYAPAYRCFSNCPLLPYLLVDK